MLGAIKNGETDGIQAIATLKDIEGKAVYLTQEKTKPIKMNSK